MATKSFFLMTWMQHDGLNSMTVMCSKTLDKKEAWIPWIVCGYTLSMMMPVIEQTTSITIMKM